MTKPMKRIPQVVLASAMLLGAEAFAAPIITGYDIQSATASGTGGWAHVYTGKIGLVAPPFANYASGTGTMADKVGGTSERNTQLFCGNAGCFGGTLNPVITFYLDGLYALSTISIFGGDFFNSIPGAITGFDVGIGLVSAAVDTKPFGTDFGSGQLPNDLADLTGTDLAKLATNRFVLSNFKVNESDDPSLQRFSIAEVTVDGRAVSAVPEPGTLALIGIALAGVGCARRRKPG